MREEKIYSISRKCTSKGKESIKGVIKMTNEHYWRIQFTATAKMQLSNV
jgi:hypothetical protein